MKRRCFHNAPSGGDAARAARERCKAAERAFKAMDLRLDALKGCVARMAAGDAGPEDALRALEAVEEQASALWEGISSAREACGNLVNDRGSPSPGPMSQSYGAVYVGDPVWPRSVELACPACRTLVRVGPAPGEHYCPRCDRLVAEPARDPFGLKMPKQ